MPNLDTEIDHLPEGGFGWALVGILCSKVHAKRRGSFNTLRLYFPKKLHCPKESLFRTQIRRIAEGILFLQAVQLAFLGVGLSPPRVQHRE